MPIMNGIDCCKEIRKLGLDKNNNLNEIKIIACTAYND